MTPLNYSFDQVKPIIKRILDSLSGLSEAEILSKVEELPDNLQAFHFTEEGEHGKYDLFVFSGAIVLFRDEREIHRSRSKVTGLSRILKNSNSFAF